MVIGVERVLHYTVNATPRVGIPVLCRPVKPLACTTRELDHVGSGIELFTAASFVWGLKAGDSGGALLTVVCSYATQLHRGVHTILQGKKKYSNCIDAQSQFNVFFITCKCLLKRILLREITDQQILNTCLKVYRGHVALPVFFWAFSV